MNLKFGCAEILIVLAWPAHADQVEWCSGVWFHQEDQGHFCDAHGHCGFMGHYGFYIDRIGGKTKQP
jgi:hypothetical protein